MSSFEWSLIAGTLILAFFTIFYSLYTGISPIPSSFRLQAAVISLLSTEEKGVIYELGAGWGSLLFPIAKRCPQASVKGYELSPIPWLVSKIRGWIPPKSPKVEIYRSDFYKQSLSDASVVVCYLYTGAMKRLSTKLKEELPPQAKVISHTFALPMWTPSEVYTLNDMYRTKVYVYEVPQSLPTEDTYSEDTSS